MQGARLHASKFTAVYAAALVAATLCGVLLGAALTPASARACAACGCGDPTLTVMGNEQPFAGRLRLALRLRARGDRIDRVHILEGRSDLTLAWTPIDRLTFSLEAPLVYRSVSVAGEPSRGALSFGDVEARVRWFVYRDRALAPRHLIALVGGVSAPTGRASSDDVGLPHDALAGTGVWSPLLGVSYAYFALPFSFFASVVGYARLGTMDGEAPGESLRITTAGQYQATPAVALRWSADLRVDARVRHLAGQREHGTGGTILFTGPDVILSPGADVIVVAGVRIPVVQALAGSHIESVLAELTVAADL